MLPIYGAMLFRNPPSTFAPLNMVPVTPDYVIGPGDELLIQAWGQVTLNSRYTVDRSGSIYIPQVGSLHVAGLTLWSDAGLSERPRWGGCFATLISM